MPTTVYIDIETPHSKGHDLKSNTLRQYTRWIREQGGILGLSVAVDDADPLWIPGTPPDEVLADLRAACEDQDTTLVAFNASFDIRILRLVLGMPHPRRVRCALDGAYAAWPNQPGALRMDAGAGDDQRTPKAYSLGSLAQTLGLGLAKLEMPDARDVEAMATYCNRDVELLRRLYKKECERLSPNEWAINEMAQLVNSMHLEVRMDKVDQAVIAFDAALKAQVEGVSEILDPEVAATLFGTDGKRVRSVKQQKVRDALLNELGFDTPTISKKQINPMKLAVAPEASKVITHTSEVNKTLNQRRRIERFSGVPEVDVELHPFRAHTGRYSGPSTGRGLNCLAAGTPILTPGGWLPIEAITQHHKVWDGVEWVATSGSVYMGDRSCITINGIMVTPDHRVLCRDAVWRPAWLALQHATTHQGTALEDGSSWDRRPNPQATEDTIVSMSDVTAGLLPISLPDPSKTALNVNAAPPGVATIPARSSPTTPNVKPACLAGTTSKTGVLIKGLVDSIPGVAEASPCATRGAMTAVPSSDTYNRSPITSTLLTTDGQSTALTMLVGTSPAISELPTPSPKPITPGEVVHTTGYLSASSLPTLGSPRPPCTSTVPEGPLMPVYDLVDCGPRSRFQAGGMIVHNCHNLPKRNPDLAKAIRSMFELPDGWCWVRADLANVEYRGVCLITRSTHAESLFTNEILADPYSAFWKEATGQVVSKKDPARHVAKGAVLGLGYNMGVNTWTNVLLQELAAPQAKITTADMKRIADAQGWNMSKYAKAHCTKMNADPAVGRVAQGSRDAFHRVHPEIDPFATWLVDSLTEACRSNDPAGALDDMSRDVRAPDPDLIRLVWEDKPDMERAVRVQIGGWDAPTVTWRDLGVRFIEGQGTGMALSFRQSGSKGYHSVYKSILSENTTQSWARVALCRGKLALRDLGYPTALSVHDEILLPVPCDRDSVLHARDSLLKVYGPGNQLGYKWAVVINPAEINVSKSLYEVELGTQWWADLEAGKTALLQELP